MARRRQKELNLTEKIQLIRKSGGRSQKSLADEYGVSRSTVQNVLKRKEDLLQAYEDNEPGQKKRRSACRFEKVNDEVWTWFCRMRAANIPISGPLLQERALCIAEAAGVSDFKASSGWLHKFKQRHNINCAVFSGESMSVNPETVDDFKSRLPDIISDFEPKNIFNVDESGLLYKALPNRTLRVRSTQCKGGKRSKERLTVLLCVNMIGEFEKPMIIGKSEKPRCFKHVDLRKLPVNWQSNKRSWMTSSIFGEWLNKFNEKMKREKRHVLLFLDNATCHPRLNLSNVKLIFFPPNTTAVLQPLDQGVIKAVKGHYRKFLLRRVISDLDHQPTSAPKSVTVLDACLWLAEAVKCVSPQTATSCFKHSGITKENAGVDFADRHFESSDLEDLIQRYQSRVGTTECTASEYMTCDDIVMNDEDEGINEASSRAEVEICELSDNEPESDTASEPDVPPITAKQALDMTEQLRDFFLKEDMPEYMELAMKMNTKIHEKLAKRSKQTTLLSFFSVHGK